MRIGFYAPLKSSDHPVPSGDRKMANLLIKTLEACGYEVEILSGLRSWEGTGSRRDQEIIHAQAQLEVKRLLQKFRNSPAPDIIFTYHVYHKAPDWIGVTLARELQIPYVIAEASTAPKQVGGPWDKGHSQSVECIREAKVIIAFNPDDVACLQSLLGPSQSIRMLNPYLDYNPPKNLENRALKEKLATQHNLDSAKVWLISVAMMREGDKSVSYKKLAETLISTNLDSWQWIAVGDGVNFDQVRGYFEDVESQCVFTGRLDQQSIRDWLSVCDVFVWPAVNEAYGFAILESLAAGLPAVVQDYGGVTTIVENNITGYVTDPGNPDEYGRALVSLINNREVRNEMRREGINKFHSLHSFENGVRTLGAVCSEVVES